MKLTAELITRAPAVFNPLEQRELVLRGLQIPEIENLAATKDEFDAIDLSDNLISRVENFPVLRRLRTLLLSGNAVTWVDVEVGEKLPGLESLVLTKNHVSSLASLVCLASLRHLKLLSLLHNPVTRHQHYRKLAIHLCPSLTVLDFARVSDSERSSADEFFRTSEGALLLTQLRREAKIDSTSPSTPAPGHSDPSDTTTSITTTSITTHPHLTAAQKEEIKRKIEKAETMEEIEALEKALREGVMPEDGGGE